jgi:hypothetical protein
VSSRGERQNDDLRNDEIEQLAIELLEKCSEARYFSGTQKQRAFVDCLQEFIEIGDTDEEEEP